MYEEMDFSRLRKKLGITQTRKDFESDLDWNLFKRDTIERYKRDREARGYVFRDNFHKIFGGKDLLKLIKVRKYRRIILIERMCELLRLRGLLPEHTNICLEDFIVHLHWYKDTFEKSPEEIREDLKDIDNNLYWGIIDSVLYEGIDVIYRYRVSPHLIRYIKKGYVYSFDRVMGRPRRRLYGSTGNFFKGKDLRLVEKAKANELVLVRDRLMWYKDTYRGYNKEGIYE